MMINKRRTLPLVSYIKRKVKLRERKWDAVKKEQEKEKRIR